MANEKQFQLLTSGADVFDNWRQHNSEKIDLSSANLNGANLAGADLSGANLTTAKLREADLAGADLTDADLWRADLTGANLSGANLRRADLKGANFTKATLSNSNLFEAAVLKEINFTEAEIIGIDFTSANLERAKFCKTRLTKINFTGAILTGVDFNDAHLTEANFTSANLFKAQFQGAHLIITNFTKANLHLAKFNGADLTRAILRESVLIGSNFSEANLSGADLYQANLTGATFYKANLTGANIFFAFRNHEYEELSGSLHSPMFDFELKKLLKVDYNEEGSYPPPYMDFVKCSVFAPGSTLPGKNIMVQVFAHCYGEENIVKDLASLFDNSAQLRASKTLAHEVKHGAELTFCLSMRNVQIDEPIQKLIWLGQPESVQFGIDVPEGLASGNIIGTVYIIQNSIPFGHVKFLLTVEASSDKTFSKNEKSEANDTWKRYKYAFISYASSDRSEVLKRV